MVVLFAKHANECCENWNAKHPPGHNVCCCINWYLPDLFSDFDSNVEQAVWIVQWGGVYSNAQQPCLASASVLWKFDSVWFGTFLWISIFGFNRESTSCLVSRFSRQQANSTPEACVPATLGVPEFVLTRNILGFSGHDKKYRSAPPHGLT